VDIYIFGQQLINGIVLGSTYGLIAIGYTMVYGIIGMINFAHGEVYMISSYMTAIAIALLTLLGINFLPIQLFLVLLLAMIFTGLYGWAIEKIAYRPLRGSTRLAPLISAIGVSLVLQNFAITSQGAKNQAIPPLIEGNFKIGGAEQFMQVTYVQAMIIIVSMLSMVALTWFIKKTPMGRACRAVQQDLVMSSILGVNSNRIISSVFIIGSVMAAIAGFLITLNYGTFDYFVGFKMGIKAFTAAVLGGIGSLPGALLGGILLGLSESLFSSFVNADYKDVFAFSLLVSILIFRPSGLLGKPAVEKV